MKTVPARSYQGTLTLKFPARVPRDPRLRRTIQAIRSGLFAAAARLRRAIASCLKEG